MLTLRYDTPTAHPQWHVFASFNGGSTWLLIGYMGHAVDAPFNALFEFSDLDEDDQQAITEMICTGKGPRKINARKRPEAFRFQGRD